MNLGKSIVFCVLFLSVICIPLASSELLSARQVPSAKMDAQTTSYTAPAKAPQSSEGGSSRNYYNVFQDIKYPLSVTKRIIGNNNGIYYENKPINVRVQVSCLAGNKIDKVYIWEYADKDLKITNCKKYIRTSVINDTIHPEKKFEDNYSYDSEGNLIYIQIKDMYSRESLIYDYVVNPIKAHNYNSYTVVRIPSSYPEYPDHIVPMEIKVVEEIPEFQVFLDLQKTEWDLDGKTVPLKYIVKYIGGSSQNPCNYNVSLSDSKNYDLSKRNFTEVLFDKHNNTPIDTSIQYFDEGIYSLPTININGQYYEFDETIRVKKPWRNYIDDRGLFLVTWLLFLSTLGLILVSDKTWQIKLGIVLLIILLFFIAYWLTQ